MIKYNPPINTRETDELIIIANSSTNDWQMDAITQAKNELQKRGITTEIQKEVINKWNEEEKLFEIKYQEQLDQNLLESYSMGKMATIFLLAPFILSGRWRVDLSLSELKRENYQKKFKHRLILLFGGILFWILFITSSFNISEKQRLEEIEKINISEWEKNRIPDSPIDTLNTIEKQIRNGL